MYKTTDPTTKASTVLTPNHLTSQGAGVDDIIKRMEAAGQEVPRDAFGHPKLDAVSNFTLFCTDNDNDNDNDNDDDNDDDDDDDDVSNNPTELLVLPPVCPTADSGRSCR